MPCSLPVRQRRCDNPSSSVSSHEAVHQPCTQSPAPLRGSMAEPPLWSEQALDGAFFADSFFVSMLCTHALPFKMVNDSFFSRVSRKNDSHANVTHCILEFGSRFLENLTDRFHIRSWQKLEAVTAKMKSSTLFLRSFIFAFSTSTTAHGRVI